MKRIFLFLLICLIPLIAPAKVSEGFWEAVKQGNFEQVEVFVKEDPKLLKARDDMLRTPLDWAAESKDLKMVNFLFTRGANIHDALVEAIRRENLDTVKFLVNDCGVCIHPKSKKNSEEGRCVPYFPLREAILQRNLEILKFLVEKGATIYLANIDMAANRRHYGENKLIRTEAEAQERSQKERVVVDWLLKSIVFEDPFLRAIQNQDLEMIRALIKKNPHIVNSEPLLRETPLMVAVRFGNPEAVKILVENGADVNKKRNGTRPLLLASTYGHLEVAKLLIESGAKVDAKDKSGFTALMCAARNGHLDVVKFLIEKGADVRKPTSYGPNAVDSALGGDQLEVFKFLTEKGFVTSPKGYLKTYEINLHPRIERFLESLPD
jgi:ankyrin repeat protein